MTLIESATRSAALSTETSTPNLLLVRGCWGRYGHCRGRTLRRWWAEGGATPREWQPSGGWGQGESRSLCAHPGRQYGGSCTHPSRARLLLLWWLLDWKGHTGHTGHHHGGTYTRWAHARHHHRRRSVLFHLLLIPLRHFFCLLLS